jgi:hypothetical protein
VFHNILSGEIDWPEGDEAVSDGAVEVIRSLLELDPKKRAALNQLQVDSSFIATSFTQTTIFSTLQHHYKGTSE